MFDRAVLIRADGNKKLGMGHLSRACLITSMLKNRFALHSKLILKKDFLAKLFINGRQTDTIFLPEHASIEEEIGFLHKLSDIERPPLFIIDLQRQNINSSYITAIKNFKCPIIAIVDDTNHTVIDADIIVNGNPGQLGKDYSREFGKYLLGPKYFLVDSAYEDVKVGEPKSEIRKILLTFGGSDQNDFLFKTLGAFSKIKTKLSFLIIVSRASGYIDSLKNYLQQQVFSYELLLDVDNLVPFWDKCDLAITSAGNTLFERIAVRLPGATLCQLKQQMEIADFFESLGVNVNFGFGPQMSDDILFHRIIDFINNRELHLLQYRKSPEIVDGKGLARLGDEIKVLLGDFTL